MIKPADLTETDIVRRYQQCKDIIEELEEEKKELQAKLNMLIPADLDAKSFTLPEGGTYIARRVKQDRRKPDDNKLVRLLSDLEAPSEAYERKPNHEYVAQMIERGQMSLEQFKSTLSGKVIEYVSLSKAK